MDHFINLDFSGSTNETNKRWIGVVGDADELLDEVVGLVQQRKRKFCSLKNWKNEKRKPFGSVKLVKRKIQISYKLKI